MTLRVPADVTIWLSSAMAAAVQIGRERVERLVEIVLEQPLHALLVEQRSGSSDCQSRRQTVCDLRQADLAGAEALARAPRAARRRAGRQLALEVAGIALERPADDRRERVAPRRAEPQRLVDELRARREQLLHLAEVVLAKGEQELDRQRLAQEPDDQLDDLLACATRRPASSKSVTSSSNWSKTSSGRCSRSRRAHALLELRVDSTTAPGVVVVGANSDGSSRRPRRRCAIRSTTSSSPARGCTRTRSGWKPSSCASGQQAGVDERRLAVARVAVEQHAAVDGDEAR